ncbi:MAG: tyrosine-type recombinase/integrase [Kouleothrix sp.]|jgi:integrase/recombinase XerC|nr:tyrosine-type recombinase/integrase [Kouleothrix sp.]
MDTAQFGSKEPIVQSIDAFLRCLEGKNRSEATRHAYETDLLQFYLWLKDNNSYASSPEKITKTDVTEFLTACARRGLSGVSRARKLAAIREYYRYLVDHEVIVKSPTAGVATPKREQNIRKHLAPYEYHSMLVAAAGSPRDYAILQVFLQTGLRVSELCALRFSDLEMSAKPYPLLHVRLGKGMRARTIALEKKVAQALKNYLAQRPDSLNDAVFLNYYGEPIGERGVRKIVAKYVQASGITKRISPHSLRHTFATQKAEKGVSTYQLQEWLGHANLNTTQVYVHLAKQSGGKVMEQTSL